MTDVTYLRIAQTISKMLTCQHLPDFLEQKWFTCNDTGFIWGKTGNSNNGKLKILVNLKVETLLKIILTMLEVLKRSRQWTQVIKSAYLQPLWKTVWRILKELKIELPYDPAIRLLGIYPEVTKVLTGKDICTPVFIAALFTIAKTWKQPKCPSMDECIKKLSCICTLK